MSAEFACYSYGFHVRRHSYCDRMSFICWRDLIYFQVEKRPRNYKIDRCQQKSQAGPHFKDSCCLISWTNISALFFKAGLNETKPLATSL